MARSLEFFRKKSVKKNSFFKGLKGKKISARQRVLIVALLLALGFILILAIRSCSEEQGGEQEELIQLKQEAARAEDALANEALKPAQGTLENPYVFEGVVSDGDTMGAILQDWLPMSEVHAIIDVSKEVYSLTKIKAGNPYTIFSSEEGMCRLEYVIDDSCKLVINREAENCYQAIIEQTPYEKQLTVVDGVIDSNLFLAVADAGEGPGLAVALGEMFGYEINFIRDLRVGDTFSILVEKRYQDGEFKSYGPLLAAYFVNQGQQFEGFYFNDGPGATYFTSKGESLKRAFLKAPLSFTRISSGYNLKRMHPIFKEVRAHPAIDYAAPTGTPVKAIGRGKVNFAGWGKGAGKHIILSHANSYESTYMHLSGFASGVKKGSSVRQGQIIGYVGSTGYSTGPHLDFRMKHNGKYINPSSVTSPREEPVKGSAKEKFKSRVALYRAWMNGDEPLSSYPAEGF